MSPTVRQITVRALIVLALVCLVVALVAGYVRRAAVDSDQFANRATVALRDDSVRSLVAEKLTDDVVIERQRDLIAARPVIESVASTIIGTRAFTSLFREAVRDVHRTVFGREKETVTLTVSDVGTVLAAALEKLRPSIAKKVEADENAELVHRDLGSVGSRLAQIADDIRILAALMAVATLLLAAGAIALSSDRRRTVVELGIGVAGAGVLLIVAWGVLRSLAIDQVEGPDGRAAAGAVWDAFLGDLRTEAWILAGSGAVLAAAAASLIKPVDIREPLARAAGWLVTEPRSPALRVVRGIGFVAAGVLVIVWRDAVLRLAITLVGVYLIYEGVSTILRLVYRAPAPHRRAARPAAKVRSDRARRVAASSVAVALIAAAIVVFVGAGGTTTAAPTTGACEGDAALCDRPLDQVVLPATHNSMSVPLPGWYSAEQERPIRDQLEDGIRGLLIDTHYADRLPNGKVRTYFGSREELRRRAKQDGVSPDAVDAALRIRERAGYQGKGERGMYLCHTLCELGATPLASVLDDIDDFLATHPDAVLVIINQDYVTPADFVAAAKKAGLDQLAYSGPTRAPLPTLREMIDDGQRVVFLAENHAGAAPWYRLAYEQMLQETPYAFSKVSQLTDPDKLPASCEANRGPKTAPLFLLNHWITTDPLPLPSNAAKVNAYKPLLRRARECGRLRGQLTNLLAVNFYKEGDLFRVVDRLNGVG
jgi:hypothetical protein